MRVAYQMEIRKEFTPESEEAFFKREKLGEQAEYCKRLYSLLCTHKKEIDAVLLRFSTHWDLARIPKTDLAVLRVGTAEILYMDDIPSAVAINEAVELAKRYGTEHSSSYVNGILGNVEKERIERKKEREGKEE